MLLRALNVEKIYNKGGQPLAALKQLNLSVPKGQFVAIMGPSGSGKSTLLHLLGGLDQPTTGSIEVDGDKLEHLSDAQLSRFRRKNLGFVFQFFNLIPTLTALENVGLPRMLEGESSQEWIANATALLASVGLSERIHHKPDELSGGEMQRVAIARALVHSPKLILADEPTGNLDSKTGEQILTILKSATKLRNQTLVMVTHDAFAASFADRKILMRDGQIEKDELQ